MDSSKLFENVSRETIDRLDAYQSLIQKWNPSINLIAKSTLSDLYPRHIVDSAQLFSFINDDTSSIVDIGSGGGLPGIVLAILENENENPAQVTLIESDARKAAFLRTVCIALGLETQIINDRIEEVAPLNADIVTARALAPLEKLLGYVSKHLAADGKAIIPKGKTHQFEELQARKIWRFDLEVHQSTTDPESVVFEIKNLAAREQNE